MKQYRVTLTGIGGSRYEYDVPLPDRVPPIEAKTRAMALHGAALMDGEVHEVVRPGAKIKRAPRCNVWSVARWRPVRCNLDIEHRSHEFGGNVHCSPKGDVWTV